MKKLFTLIALLGMFVSGAWSAETLVKSWVFTSINAVPTYDNSVGTVTINRQQCDYGTGSYEGLAFQGATWYGNTNGIRNGNGERNIAILNLEAGDKVVITCAAANIGKFVNMTEDQGSTGATNFIYTLHVIDDGVAGFAQTDRNTYIKSIHVYRDPNKILMNEQWSIDFTTIGSVSYAVSAMSFGRYTGYQLLNSIGVITNANFGVAPKENNNVNNFYIRNNKLYAYYSGNRNIYFKELEEGQYVKIVADIAPTSTDLEKVDELSEGTNYVFRVKSDGAAAVSITRYTSISSVAVLSTKEVDGARVGYTNMSSAENGPHSADITLAPGETLKYTFRNHGQDFGKNWRIFVMQGSVEKSITRADSWDAVSGAATKTAYQVSKDGGNTREGLNWDEYKADMANATVEATLTYGNDGTLAIITESTGDANGYIYYVDQDVTDLEGNITVNLSVCNSWLEILSAEKTTPVTISAAGYATFVTPYAMDFSSSEKISAYWVEVGAETVTLHSVDAVPANTAIVVKGATDNVDVIESAEPLNDNKLTYSETALAYDAEANITFYVLAQQGGNVVFAPVGSGSIAARKGFFRAATSGAAPRFTISFGDDATAIEEIQISKVAETSEVFNLSGQRVSNNFKGIVIKNGAKYLNK